MAKKSLENTPRKPVEKPSKRTRSYNLIYRKRISLNFVTKNYGPTRKVWARLETVHPCAPPKICIERFAQLLLKFLLALYKFGSNDILNHSMKFVYGKYNAARPHRTNELGPTLCTRCHAETYIIYCTSIYKNKLD